MADKVDEVARWDSAPAQIYAIIVCVRLGDDYCFATPRLQYFFLKCRRNVKCRNVFVYAFDTLNLVGYILIWAGCTAFPTRLHMRPAFTKTCLYNFGPLNPHFYAVKLGFTGVYINFLVSAQNIDCGHSLEPPRRGGSNKYPQSMFWAEIWKLLEFFIWKFSCFGGKIFNIFE